MSFRSESVNRNVAQAAPFVKKHLEYGTWHIVNVEGISS